MNGPEFTRKRERVAEGGERVLEIEYWCTECQAWVPEDPWAHVCPRPVRGEWRTWTEDAVGRDFLSALAGPLRAKALQVGAGC